MNKLNCDTSEYTNPLEGKVKALEKETTGLKTSLAIVTDTVSQLIADKVASASLAHANLAQKVIDSAETKTENMSFGEALEELKQGNCVARKGWNGKGIFIKLKKGETLNTPNNRFDEVMTHDFIYIDTTGLQTDNPDAPKSRVPWFASQTDMLARDWYIA